MSACILAWTFSTVSAQQRWSLRDCIEHAIENNIEIKQAQLTVEEQEVDFNTTRNSRLPSVNASISQSFSFGRTASYETNLYENSQSSHTSVSASSSIPIYSGMRINNQVKQVRLNLKAATENLQKAKENLELQVAQLYLEALYCKEIHRVNSSQYDLIIRQLEMTQILVDEGRSPAAQLYDLRSQLATAELNLAVSGNNMDEALLNLRQALNILEIPDFDIVEPDPSRLLAEAMESGYSPDEIYHIAVEVKPHIREANYRLESSRKAVDIARAEFYPSVSLGLSYNNGYSYVFSNDRNEKFRNQLKSRGNEGIGLNVSIPVFAKFQTRNRVKSARIAVTYRELELENIKMSIYKEIQQAWQRATSARVRYMAAEKAEDAALTAHENMEERYTAGKATPYELEESRTKLFSSRSDRVQAKYEAIFREKILDFYRGEPIDVGF